MVTKQIISQYYDLLREQKEVEEKIESLEIRIPKLEERIAEIEAGATVKDRVYGGEGGIQGFNIEGIPTPEYEKKRSDLLYMKLLVEERRAKLKYLRVQIAETINEVEEFILSIDDSHIRRIVNLRVVQKLTWNDIAARMGGGNTEDSVRKAFMRFFEKI